MKPLIFRSLLLFSVLLFTVNAAAEKTDEEWQATVLTDATIKKIQDAKFEYKKCIGEQMQKPAFQKMDSRNATEEIIKQCEPVLAKMRAVYLSEKVPPTIADRHLRQMRIQITRKVLQEMMFFQASHNAGQP